MSCRVGQAFVSVVELGNLYVCRWIGRLARRMWSSFTMYVVLSALNH